MKFKLFFIFLFLYTTQLLAKEGMWFPFLLKNVNEKEMRQMGMKIKASDIYDVNEGSLKDAVMIFGGGCTGEVISNQGLVLTNHHCGYGAVQGLSSVDHNYLLNGFWAQNRSQELPCPGLSVTFIVRIDEVTQDVRAGITEDMPDSIQNKMVLANMAALEKQRKAETGYDVQIKSFYSDNQYYLYLMEKFTDIRLVGFPPNGIGKFGGDADNWAWPRHTGDFGVFRIYANKENKPATFNENNIPFTPRKSFKINIQGVEQNDFTWVYGFPGRTAEYLTSDGVAEIMETLDPARISIREKRLEIMDADMKKDENTFIQYASKQAGIANYYKKWKGELLGLKKNNAIEKKKKQELAFVNWVNEDEERKNKYGAVINDLAKAYQEQKPFIKKNEYINEAIWASELLKKGVMLQNMLKAVDTINDMNKLSLYEKELNDFYKSINKQTDYKISKALFDIFTQEIETDKEDLSHIVDAIYEKSLLSSANQISNLIKMNNKTDIKKAIENDIAYKTYNYFDQWQKSNMVSLKASQLKITRLYKTYMQGLMEYKDGKQFYPDANSTLRVTYGKVEGIKPQDGLIYNYYTTLDGAIAKHNSKVEEFKVPEKLQQLYAKKDFGDYYIEDEDGNKTVPLAFLASNHTTGGNSGSPVLNAYGELIGTNFDRIWEGTMSDIMYDIDLCRNISLDVRYTLFIIEKFGNAKWLIDEMDIVR